MASSNQHYLIYLEQYRLYLYGAQMEQALFLDLPTNVLRDMEVLNRDQLFTLIETFLSTNALGTGTAIMVLSQQMLFEKQLLQDLTDENKKNEAIKEYAENVPFEQVAYVTYSYESGLGVIATNEELFSTIKRTFERKNIEINLVLPIRAYGDVQVNTQSGLDGQTATYLLQNADHAKTLAFHLVEAPVTPRTVQEKKKADNKRASKRMPIYLSVFGFLILVLVVMITINNQPPPQKPVTTSVDAQAPAAAAIPPPVVSPVSSSSATFNKSLVKVQIKAGPDQKVKVDEIKTRLITAGYTAVDVVDALPGPSTMVFLDKSKLTQVHQDTIIAELKSILPHFSIQLVDQAQYDIQVVAGQDL